MIVDLRCPTWNCLAIFGELYSESSRDESAPNRGPTRELTNHNLLAFPVLIGPETWLTSWRVMRKLVDGGEHLLSDTLGFGRVRKECAIGAD